MAGWRHCRDHHGGCKVNSWGRLFEDRKQRLVDGGIPSGSGARHSLLARGNSRSYGDVALNTGGTVLSTGHLSRIVEHNWEDGWVRVGAGMLLSELDAITRSYGWMVPVVPGTQFVTVGGCIANDVHGKNHHHAGSFGCHINALTLQRSDGTLMSCSPDDNSGYYAASIGGLGLTGLIVDATLSLAPYDGDKLTVHTSRFKSLEGFFSLSEKHHDAPYSVAWLDAMSISGRGIFQTASGNASTRISSRRAPRPLLSIPFPTPISMINRSTASLLASVYRALNRPGTALTARERYLFPLDRISFWNRLYGPRGFVQFQCVLPEDRAEVGVMFILQQLRSTRTPTFLTVLKKFGKRRSPGLLSFPRPGTTLAIDMPFSGNSTVALMANLEDYVMASGGAIYPAKDALMRPETFVTQSPSLDRFMEHRDRGFNSDFARRVIRT